MSSIIEGYTYDIFISYRQKDNKYDGWVTEFVNNLKQELEATFKEEISVYFDINPHDGLLETHDVDASLKEKLKCLVFIPIISRTYCDPKSFAWEHEFKAFIEQASKDRFGLKVKLPGGNVASRVLPVQIHDLDVDDKKLVENELGGHMRGIEFIYKEPGVNKPLTSDDDEKKNLNNTKYRIQINKTALAISEIISGLKKVFVEQIKNVKEEISEQKDVGQSIKKEPVPDLTEEKKSVIDEKFTGMFVHGRMKKLIYSFSSLFVILSIVAIFLFSSGSTLPFSKRDWILITDFENLTDDPVFDKSLYTAFSLCTSQSRYINVFPRSRMLETLKMMEIEDQATIDEKTGREMAVREGINIYIVPSISEVGNRYAITAKIIETKTANLLKSEILYAETEGEILPALDKLSSKLRRNLGESRYNIAAQNRPLLKVTTSSLEALKQYTMGTEYLALKMNYKDAKEYFENALRIDSGFTAARASLGILNIEKFDLVKGRELLDQAAKSVDKLTERERLNIIAIHAFFVENDIPKCIEYTKRVTELYPDNPAYHNNLGVYYMRTNKFEESLKEYKTALKIRPDMGVVYQGIVWIYLQNLGRIDSALLWADKWISGNPQNAWGHCYLGLAYISIDSIAKAEMAFGKAREIAPDFIWNLYELAHTYRIQKRYQEAIRILGKIVEIDRNEASAYYDLGVNYQAMRNQQEANKYFSIYKNIITERTKNWPGSADLYLSLGSVTARLGDFESSEQMLHKAVEMDSTFHYRFAEVLCLQGKITEALDELEKAFDNGYRELFWLKLNPDWLALQYDVRFRDLIEKYFKQNF